MPPRPCPGSEKFAAPSLRHLFGTDNFGRDIFSRVMVGARTTFFISACTVTIGAVVGTLVGALTGYFGGLVDELLMRVNDAVTAFPSILLALGVHLPSGLRHLQRHSGAGHRLHPQLRPCHTGGVHPAAGDELCEKRPAHGGQPPADHAGTHPAQHPQVLLPTLAIGFNNAVLAEASMSFLGIGVKPPEVSLGYMMSESQSYMVRAPWYMLTCGSVIVLLILGVSLIGEGLQQKKWGR